MFGDGGVSVLNRWHYENCISFKSPLTHQIKVARQIDQAMTEAMRFLFQHCARHQFIVARLAGTSGNHDHHRHPYYARPHAIHAKTATPIALARLQPGMIKAMDIQWLLA